MPSRPRLLLCRELRAGRFPVRACLGGGPQRDRFSRIHFASRMVTGGQATRYLLLHLTNSDVAATSIGISFQAENGLPETPIPLQGCLGMLGVDCPVHVAKVAYSAVGDVNDVCHAWRRTRRKTPHGPSLSFSRRPAPDECLPPRRRRRQRRAGADTVPFRVLSRTIGSHVVGSG
jgi:hypothetical protein